MNSSFFCMNAEPEQAYEESGKLELRNCVITKFGSNANAFLGRFSRTQPWQPRRNFKPIKLQNSSVHKENVVDNIFKTVGIRLRSRQS